MADLLRTVLIMSATGSVLALLLFALKPLVRHRLPKSTQYYLWLVVIAALFVPVSRLVVLPAGSQAAMLPIPVVPTISETVTRFVITQAEETEMLMRIAPLAETNPPVYLQERQAVRSPLAFVTTYIVLVYPMGVLILLLYYGIHYAIFIGLYRRRNSPVDPATLAVVAHMCGRRPPRIYFNALAETPMLFGILRPAIILPNRQYTDNEMQAVLAHELTHLRRKDVLVKWLALIATALHWFNPLVWLVRSEIDRACELSCDEAVIQNMDGQGRRQYGNTLINVAAHPKTPRAIASATMSEDKKNLKVRLGAIMRIRRPARYIFLISALLIVATIGLAACLGSGRGDDPVVIESETTAGYSTDYYGEPDYPGYTDDTLATELILHMTPIEDAPLGDFDSYHEIDYRDVHNEFWNSDTGWLTVNAPAVIWANAPLYDFQIIGLYYDFLDDGAVVNVTHVYYEIAVLDAPLVLSWFFTAGLIPNNGISFTDTNGVRRSFVIQAAYGYQYDAPFTLIEFREGEYIFRLDAPDGPADGNPEIISGNFEITIPSIAPGEIILLGILDIQPGENYRLTVSSASGIGLFAGVTDSPNITDAAGRLTRVWRPLTATAFGFNTTSSQVTYNHGFRYLYVGSTAAADSGEELTDVLVSLTRIP